MIRKRQATIATSKNLTAYVLAGGRSSRFGRDKALVELGGTAMLTRMLKLLRDVAKIPRVVGSREKYGDFCGEIINDQWPGEGPLGGIITALEDAHSRDETTWSIIIGCDMPFLTWEWIQFLACTGLTGAGDVFVPRSEQGLEPLSACWRAAAVRKLRPAFERGVRKVTEGIALLRSEVLDERVWKRFDSAGLLFWNMNTLADYEEARRIVDGGASPSPTGRD